MNYEIIKRFTKEEEYINYIMKTFEGEDMVRQYKIENYKVDLYFPKYNLAIECDEHGHSDRDKDYELERENVIKTVLKASILRFNPDDINFDIFKAINMVYKHIIKT